MWHPPQVDKRAIKRALKSRLRRVPEVGRRSVPRSTYLGEGQLLVGTRWRTHMVVPSDDLSITAELALHGEYDPWLAAFLRRHLPEGGTFIDVGAHYGTFSLLAASLVGRGGSVISYEPNPAALRFLRTNIAMNHAPQITVVPTAAWHEPTTLPLVVPARFSGSSHIADHGDEPFHVTSTETVMIDAEPLDERCADRPVDVMKIDVEGFEAAVLRGASRTLKRCRMVVFEALPDLAGDRWGELIGLLSRLMSEHDGELSVPRGQRGHRRPISLGEFGQGAGWTQAVLRLGGHPAATASSLRSP
jgi:FkbM family methyltransferase